ncbi:response regulator [Dissulfurirhabdus thermomarina]|uniref:Response regulator n=1 Tax=Dissulfurirhabdus thermomarina TaxID=1765737 RepID=A0A6N9TPZ8_DISTH|nr:response regulator [Dissulfurirhabdus thermomarina]NDY41814.1 response regulator [Dissulfurirhabdus thermomarina]NMX24045.1 response regulator [Dissulfurirhabdus thermomarina]
MAERETVLIVDDEENVLAALRRLLRREGYRILTATGGEEALALLRETPADVIVADQRMPGMSGTEFLERAREISPLSVRMILSGYTAVDAITEAVNRGHVFKFLLKPWDDDELKAVVREALEVARLRRENDRLARELRERNRELEDWNRRLEERVADRTRELELRNRVLENYQHVLHQVPVGVLGVGDDGLVAFANDRARRILGGADPVLLEAPVAAVLGPETAREVAGVGPGRPSFRGVLQRPGGSPVEVRAAPVRYPHGAVGRVVVLIERDGGPEEGGLP